MNVCLQVSIRRSAANFIAAALLSVCALANAGPTGTVERMYVFNCGESKTKDLSVWSPGFNVGKAFEFSDHCYLIKHAKGLMLWDTGMSDSIAAMPDGLVVGGGMLTLRVPKTLASQLSEMGIEPTAITHLAISHFHSDHCGNANLFTAATLYIQEAEYDAAFGPDAAKFNYAPANYDKLRASPVVKLNGDRDVFGDDSVVILATPGHTPGHQSLLVRLPKTGVVVLTGDMVHFEENWVNRRIPARNFNKEQSAQSMEKVAALLAQTKGQLWINHDKVQNAQVPKAPDYVE